MDPLSRVIQTQGSQGGLPEQLSLQDFVQYIEARQQQLRDISTRFNVEGWMTCDMVRTLFDVTRQDTMHEIEAKWANKTEELRNVWCWLSTYLRGFNYESDEQFEQMNSLVTQYQLMLNQMTNHLHLLQASLIANTPSVIVPPNEDQNGRKEDGIMECWAYIKKRIHLHGYRHEAHSDLLLKQKRIEYEGKVVNTRFFEPMTDPQTDAETADPFYYLESFVHHQFGDHVLFNAEPAKAPLLYEQFVKSPNLPKKLARMLTHTNEMQFPVCSPDRGMFSFRNGIYDAPANRWYTWQQLDEVDPEGTEFCTSNYFDYDLAPEVIEVIQDSDGLEHPEIYERIDTRELDAMLDWHDIRNDNEWQFGPDGMPLKGNRALEFFMAMC